MVKIKHFDKHNDSKVIIYFLLVIIAVGMLVLLQTNMQFIMAANMLSSFLLLVFVGVGLLMGLMYLVSQSKTKRK